MNKIFTVLVICLLISINATKAQIHWDGNNPGSIYYNGGNVGIGTTMPWSGAKLTIENTLATKPVGVNGYYSYLSSNWSEANAFELGISDGSNFHKLVTSSNYHFGSILQFWSADNERMRIISNGNVGIGTTIPKEKLQINGNAAIIGSNNRLKIWNDDTNPTYAMSLGGWDESNNRIESSGRELFITSYNGGISFGNNGIKQHKIDANGNVGIGTTTPTSKLEVLSGVSNNEIARFGGTVSERGLRLSSFMVGGTNEVGFNFNAPGAGGAAAISFSTLSTERMRVNYDGNVGIGTTSPTNTLTLSKMSGGANLARISFDGQTGDANNSINGGIEFHNNNYPYYSAVLGYRGVNSHEVGLYFKTSFLNNGGITAMTIVPNGNVGIGVTNPQYKLTVEGTIAAREVNVTTETWSDFVFHSSYKLRSLGEVEQFIKANSHLPEIPSAAEVKENGIGLGEMNAKLLQKIEELTLYMIEQQKQMVEMKNENEDLKSRVNKLEKKDNNK